MRIDRKFVLHASDSRRYLMKAAMGGGEEEGAIETLISFTTS